jgi:hypothetical protein
MCNHVHLLIRQGLKPLSCFAQSFFRRLALRIQLRYDREGHIFKGSYYDGLCKTVYHMRTAIDYIHFNPVDSALCKTTDEYAWSSCPWYTGCDPAHLVPNQPKITVALGIFASAKNRSTAQLQRDYRKFAEHQALCRTLPEGALRPREPRMRAGEEIWTELYGTGYKILPVKRPDLRDIVRTVIAEVAPQLPLEQLRARRGGATISAVRREVVLRATLAGHRGVAIADFLNISKAAVSKTRAQILPIPELKVDTGMSHELTNQLSSAPATAPPTSSASPSSAPASLTTAHC